MAIVIGQPEPMNAATSAGYGAVEQRMREIPLEQQAAQMRQNAYQFEAQRIPSIRDQWLSQQQQQETEKQRAFQMDYQKSGFDLQSQLHQTQLNQAETMRMQKLQRQVDYVQEQVGNRTYTQEEGNDMITQLRTGLDPLQERSRRSQMITQQLQQDQMRQQMADQAAIRQRNAEFEAQGIPGRTAIVPNRNNPDEVAQFLVDAQGHWQQIFPGEGGAGARGAGARAPGAGAGRHAPVITDDGVDANLLHEIATEVEKEVEALWKDAAKPPVTVTPRTANGRTETADEARTRHRSEMIDQRIDERLRRRGLPTTAERQRASANRQEAVNEIVDAGVSDPAQVRQRLLERGDRRSLEEIRRAIGRSGERTFRFDDAPSRLDPEQAKLVRDYNSGVTEVSNAFINGHIDQQRRNELFSDLGTMRRLLERWGTANNMPASVRRTFDGAARHMEQAAPNVPAAPEARTRVAQGQRIGPEVRTQAAVRGRPISLGSDTFHVDPRGAYVRLPDGRVVSRFDYDGPLGND